MRRTVLKGPRVAVAGVAAAGLVAAVVFAVSASSSTGMGPYFCDFGAESFTCTVSASPTPSPTPTPTPSPTPSPSPTAVPVLWGQSFGGSSVGAINTATAQWPTAKVGRFYFPGDPTVYASSPLTAIPAGDVIMVSFKAAVSAVSSGAYDAAFTTVLRSWNASGRTIFWTWQHEADNPSKGIDPAAYRAGWAHLLSVEQANPSNAVHSMAILMAYVLAPSRPHGDPASWYVPTDVLGFDCYDLTTEPLAESYANAKGKPLAFPEIGAGIVPGNTDAQSLAFARAFYAGLSPGVFAVAWFNALNNSLSGLPQTLAYLKSVS